MCVRVYVYIVGVDFEGVLTMQCWNGEKKGHLTMTLSDLTNQPHACLPCPHFPLTNSIAPTPDPPFLFRVSSG